jgi:hypothetical protein
MAKGFFIALWHGGQGEGERGVECQSASHTQQCRCRPGAQDIAETPCGPRVILFVFGECSLSAIVVLAMCRTCSIVSVVSSRRKRMSLKQCRDSSLFWRTLIERDALLAVSNMLDGNVSVVQRHRIMLKYQAGDPCEDLLLAAMATIVIEAPLRILKRRLC